MEYTTRTVRSKPGLSQEDALTSLQEHPLYKDGTRIISLRKRENRWHAKLMEPKTAEFPPSDEGGEEGAAPKPPEAEGPPSDDGPPEGGGDEGGDEGSDGPPKDGEKKDKGGEKGEIKSLLNLVQQIADALGISPDSGLGDMGGPDDLGPGPDGPGGPGGPPPPHDGGGLPGSADKNPGQLPTKLGPGEVLPHQTPMGAPAFASSKTASPVALAPGGAPAGLSPSSPTPAGNTACPSCGGPMINGHCPSCSAGGAGTPQSQPPLGMAAKVASFSASKADPQRETTIKQAKENLEALYGAGGYQVKQIKRDGAYIRALLSVR